MGRLATVALAAALAVLGADVPSETIENTGKPMKVPLACKAADLDSIGLSCSEEEPCPMYLELSAVEAVGGRLFLTGNIHGATATVQSILLGSSDGGKTWTEPHERIRYAALDQIQFFDMEYGWIAGATIQTLPRDPFLLLTTDGGKTWRQRPLFEEPHQGSIDRFWFDSRTTGTLLLTPVEGNYELYESKTGGDSWMVKQVSSKQPAFPQGRTSGDSGWRLRTDARSRSYNVETKQTGGWQRVASFQVEVGVCK